MRLDHLLSREKAEVETRKPNQGRCDPEEAERSEEGSENKKMRTAQVIRCYPKRVSLCIVFRVRLTEEHAHLDNCTAKKDSRKGQLRFERIR